MTVSQTIPDHVRAAAIEAAHTLGEDTHYVVRSRRPYGPEGGHENVASCACGVEFTWSLYHDQYDAHVAEARAGAVLDIVAENLRKYSEVVLSGRYIPVYMWREGCVGEEKP